jgi:M6 family metalloprotease-like protein
MPLRPSIRRTIAALAVGALTAVIGFPSSSAPSSFQTVTLSGWFQIAYGDAPAQASGGRAEFTRFELLDDAGATYELTIDTTLLAGVGGPRALNGRRVTITGDLAPVSPPVVVVHAIQLTPFATGAAAPASVDAAQAVSGPQPWVTILCKFSDSPSIEPHPVSYYEALVSTVHPGLDDFWQEVSYSQASIDGSIVLGWYMLPLPRSSYVVGSSFDLNRAFTDCTAQADASVNFPDFVGINLMFNRELDGFSWGGTRVASLDGVPKIYSTTWIAASHQAHQYVLAHEMGHGFGLPHSSGPYSTPYDSEWDPMSAGGVCDPPHPTYGCLGVHTIAHHKNILGWIPSDRQVTVPPGGSETVVLERLAEPTSPTSLLMARVSIGGSSTSFYTVEARRFAGYDVQVPGEGIVIHRVDTTLSDREAQVVDPDGDGDPNDDAAIWLPGETFSDSANQIVIAVIAATGTGYQVTVQNAPPPAPPTVRFSSATYTVSEAGPSATITVQRVGSSAGTVTVQYATSNGSARVGTDYSAATGVLTFGSGVTSQTFTVPILDDSAIESTETVDLSLFDPSGATLGSPSTAVLNVVDNDVPGTLALGAATFSVTEDVGSATITVVRTGGAAAGVTVHYATSDGTASAGVHYTATSGTLTFAGGQTSRTFTVPIIDNTIANSARTFTVALSSPGPTGAALGSPASAPVTIADNEVSLRFSAETYSVAERRKATITLTRQGPTSGTVSVRYATSDGTASAGSDYTATSGILGFTPGVTSRTFTVSTRNSTVTGNRTVNLTLSNPSGPGAMLGIPSTAVLTIVDDEGGSRPKTRTSRESKR